MSTPERARWLKYAAAASSRTATADERRALFDAWWKPEKADAMASKQAEQKATKREQAKALR